MSTNTIKFEDDLSLQHRWQLGDQTILNIASVEPSTQALGPGLRAALYVQGCPFRCPHCMAKSWQPIQPARLVTPEDILPEILNRPDITGLTLSGGEPMLQAQALAELVRQVRSKKDLDIICFTGFTLEHLLVHPPVQGVNELLDRIDVLIDGPYVDEWNTNRGLRGSNNQTIHHLTGRLANIDLENWQRRAQVRIRNGEIAIVGIPPKGVNEAIRTSVCRSRTITSVKETAHVRP